LHSTDSTHSDDAQPRSPVRLKLAHHLQQCGPRAILEALIAFESGQPVGAVLEDFARLRPETYSIATCVAELIAPVAIRDGGQP
jgi:hypothetical protein